jgi:hypothetical protein
MLSCARKKEIVCSLMCGMFDPHTLQFGGTHVGGYRSNYFLRQTALNLEQVGKSFIDSRNPQGRASECIGQCNNQPQSISDDPYTT